MDVPQDLLIGSLLFLVQSDLWYLLIGRAQLHPKHLLLPQGQDLCLFHLRYCLPAHAGKIQQLMQGCLPVLQEK